MQKTKLLDTQNMFLFGVEQNNANVTKLQIQVSNKLIVNYK